MKDKNIDNENYYGDRECPECGINSLIEHSNSKWKCLKCNRIFDEEWLDN